MPADWIVPLFVGWVAGWLVNYLSDVLPITRRLSRPACLQCGASFSAAPYLFLRPCPNGHARPIRVWLAQAALTLLSVYAFFQPPLKIGYWGGALLLAYFGVVFVIDMEHRLILHPTSIAGLALAALLGTLRQGVAGSLKGGLTGLAIMLVFYYFGVLFGRVRAKRMRAQGMEADDEEALGQGDIILVTILGFLVGGWYLIVFLILLSTLLGGAVSVLLIARLALSRRYNANALMVFIPYGPYFIAGATLIVFFPKLLQAILPS